MNQPYYILVTNFTTHTSLAAIPKVKPPPPHYVPDWRLITDIDLQLLLLAVAFFLVSYGINRWRK